jgi:NhaP-type Na+/H+ or K+/H+ antiporter
MSSTLSNDGRPERRPRWWETVDWPGAIAFVLAFGVAIGFAVAIILAASWRTPPISEQTATLFSTLGGAIIGAVATYLGGTIQRNHDRKGPDDSDEQGL